MEDGSRWGEAVTSDWVGRLKAGKKNLTRRRRGSSSREFNKDIFLDLTSGKFELRVLMF